MNKRRQELYERIRSSSKTEVIREEMVRLGFWKTDSGPAEMTNEWLDRRAELSKEVNQLAKKQKKFENREAMLKEMRSRRMAEARQRRAETKERHERQRKERADAWSEKQRTDIVYLGEGVSGGLENSEDGNPEKLAAFDLPQIKGIEDIGRRLGITVKELRFLAFHRKVSKTSHYRRFFMPKKSGGQRLISAPMPRLKEAQYMTLFGILDKIPVHEAAHGFVPERSILTNAQQHVGKDLVINMDLKDFFPSVSYPRTKGVFRALGYSEKVATVFGLLCTEPDADEVELDGERYFIHSSDRQLPQGAPTSPAITNVLCYRLDKRLAGMAKALGYTYTRYADDLTFSCSGRSTQFFKRLLWRSRSIVESEGFQLHPEKTRIMRRGRQQEVTGLTVNDKVSVPRRDLRNFRALLHQIERDGPEGKKWRGSDSNLLAAIRGYAYFIRMVDESKGDACIEQVERILSSQNWKHVIRHPKKVKAVPPPLPKEQSGGLLGKFKSLFRKR